MRRSWEGAESEGECALFKGNGGLSLGMEEASGRVDIPVSVIELLSSEMVFRSSQSVALVTPGSRVGGREPEGAQGYGLHGNVGDGNAKFWATVNGKRVGLHDTMTDIGICDQDIRP